MPLTRPKAHQLSGQSAKSSVRVVTTANVTLSGGAPASVDGVSLTLEDRILVTAQTDATENGIYRVTTVGSGSNGTWVRGRDANQDEEVLAGMTTMVSEGTTYADTFWKLSTDGDVTLGTTELVFEQHSTVEAKSIANLSDVTLTSTSSNDVLTYNGSAWVNSTSIDLSGNIDGANVNIDDTLRIAQSGSGLRMTNVGAFDNDGSDNFRIFATNELSIGANGETGNAVYIDTSNNLTVNNALTATGNITAGNLTTAGTMQADIIRNREQRYTTSNMMKFNQLYTGAASGSYFTENEYQKIVTIIPSGDAENYQVSGRILCQTAQSIQTINFKAALRSGTLPDLDWSIHYDEDHNGTAHFKPQLWTKETTTAGFIFAIQKISAGNLYGTVTVDLDVIPRTSSQLDNVTVNTTQDSEQTSVDTGYTANDMTLVRSISNDDVTFNDTLTATGNITAGNITTAGQVTATGNITGGNLVTTGTVTLDRLALTSSQTTVSPLQLTASSLNDGVGALRIDGAQADIFLNPDTATHTTVTFAVNDDQRLAFGMDNSSDFYITRRTGGTWYDDTLVIDRDTGLVSLGYDLTVAGDLDLNDADAVFVHGDTGYKNKRYVLYGTTTDATVTEIFVGGTANSRVAVNNNTTMFYTVDIVARRTDATGESAGWQLKGVADNFSGTTADVGDVYEVAVARDDTNWEVDCLADDTEDAIVVTVTGAASKTVKWMAVVKTMEVAN